MLPLVQMNKLVVFALFLTVVKAEVQNMSIPLNKTLTQNNKELYGQYVLLKKNSTLSITLMDVNIKVDYYILQAHSHFYNITMYNNTLNRKSSVTGTNVGLYGSVQSLDNYYIMNRNPIDLKLYITVHGYTMKDPLPGGCNLEWDVPVPPYMRVANSKDMVLVDATASKDVADEACVGGFSHSEVIFYRMYLEEGDFDTTRYFLGLRKMMTLDKIKENGIEVPMTNPYKNPRRYLSAYPGTGTIYVAVAYNKYNHSLYAIYVPTYTYACSPLQGCKDLDDYVSQLFCAGLIFVGLFACSLGHRFFKTEMFLVGTFAGVIITYILLTIWSDLEHPVLLGASLLTGLFFGGIWILLWWFYGIPILSVALATMHLGFLVAAIVYHCAPGGNAFFASDARFWSIFILLMVCCSITLTTVSYLSNMLCCAILGGYAVVFGMDHYFGTNLKYLVYNTIRRATVTDFHFAVLALPFQWQDILLTLLWVALSFCGFVFQYYHNRGRSPFPPPPRSLIRVAESASYGAIERRPRWFGVPNGLDRTATAASERTPLLEEESIE